MTPEEREARMRQRREAREQEQRRIIREWAEAKAAEAPPLTDEQKSTLRRLLRPGSATHLP